MTKKILWAEDRKKIFLRYKQLLSEYLEQHGIIARIEEAKDGNEVFRKLHENTYDVVVLDIEMPHFNGLQTIKLLHETNPKYPLFVVSSYLNKTSYRKEVDEFKQNGIIIDYYGSDEIKNWLEGLKNYLFRQKFLTILNISDIHFGATNQFDKTYYKLFLDDCLKKVSEEKPDILVIPGDLANKGEEDDFREAKKFIEFLIDILTIKKSNVIITPGNHDIFRATEKKRRFDNFIKLLNDFYRSNSSSRDGLKRYLKLYDQGHKELRTEKMTEPSNLYFVAELNEFKTIIFGFNSVEINESKFDLGTCHREQLSYAIDYMKNINTNGMFKIAVFHHHLLSIPSVLNIDASKVLTNAGFVLNQLLNMGIKLILHGHTHRRSGYRYEPFFIEENAYSASLCVYSPGKFHPPPQSTDPNMHLSIINVSCTDIDQQYKIQVIPYEIDLEQGISNITTSEIRKLV